MKEYTLSNKGPIKLKDFYNMDLTNYHPHRCSISSVNKSNIEILSTPQKDSLENSIVDMKSQIHLSIEVKNP
jgi:hypothetical protein